MQHIAEGHGRSKKLSSQRQCNLGLKITASKHETSTQCWVGVVDAGSTLGQRCRRRSNIGPSLGQSLVFAGQYVDIE